MNFKRRVLGFGRARLKLVQRKRAKCMKEAAWRVLRVVLAAVLAVVIVAGAFAGLMFALL